MGKCIDGESHDISLSQVVEMEEKQWFFIFYNVVRRQVMVHVCRKCGDSGHHGWIPGGSEE